MYFKKILSKSAFSSITDPCNKLKKKSSFHFYRIVKPISRFFWSLGFVLVRKTGIGVPLKLDFQAFFG